MSTDDTMPRDFGLKYIFWICCRWVYFNPLTLLFIAQEEMVNFALEYPTAHWISRGVSFVGVIIAQVRNSGRNYTIPVRGRYNETDNKSG